MRMANHTDYSDYKILKAVEDQPKGKGHLTKAYMKVMEETGLRLSQVSGRHDKLRKNGLTSNDFKDYTAEDKENFHPGDGEPIARNRPSSPNGYGERTSDNNWSQGPSPFGSTVQSPGHRDVSRTTQMNLKPLNTQENMEKKTILVVYTNKKEKLTPREVRASKVYAFNSASDLKTGDVIESPSYNTNMQVVGVLDDEYRFYNNSTGDLSNKFTSTNQREVVTLVIREDDSDVVYGSIVKSAKDDE